MDPQAILDDLCATLEGVAPKRSWGETALFYNPGRALPNGVYFCTLKDRDGANDRASALDREGVFRVSIGVPPETYVRLFGPRPARPAKGGVVTTGHDFTALDVLTPHPIYAWMGWVQILSPTTAIYATVRPLIVDAHRFAAAKLRARRRSPVTGAPPG
jgi:hypothetical protein